jgi:protoporphyrinogen oxidase
MTDIPQILFVILWFAMIVFAFTMIAQGWMISNESNGYRADPKVKWHPEMSGVRKGDKLMTVRFGEPNEEDSSDADLSELYERIQKQKMAELFEEPSTYEDEEDT